MDPILVDLLLPATVILTWALGVQVAIWWPSTTGTASSRTRALHAIRYAAVGVEISFLVLALVIHDIQDGALFPFILGTIAYSTLFQTPLALTALVVARGERALAIAGTLLSLVFVTGLLWYSFLLALTLLTYGVVVLGALAFLALVCSAGALAGVMELYVAIRQPRATWDASRADLL